MYDENKFQSAYPRVFYEKGKLTIKGWFSMSSPQESVNVHDLNSNQPIFSMTSVNLNIWCMRQINEKTCYKFVNRLRKLIEFYIFS